MLTCYSELPYREVQANLLEEEALENKREHKKRDHMEKQQRILADNQHQYSRQVNKALNLQSLIEPIAG